MWWRPKPLNEAERQLQEKYQKYAKYMSESSSKMGRLEMLRVELARATGEIEQLPQRGVLEIELTEIENSIEESVRRILKKK